MRLARFIAPSSAGQPAVRRRMAMMADDDEEFHERERRGRVRLDENFFHAPGS